MRRIEKDRVMDLAGLARTPVGEITRRTAHSTSFGAVEAPSALKVLVDVDGEE